MFKPKVVEILVKTKPSVPKDLSNVLNNLVLGDGIEESDAYEKFIEDIVDVVCNYCGGEVDKDATFRYQGNVVAIQIKGNDSLPDTVDNIWKDCKTGKYLCSASNPAK